MSLKTTKAENTLIEDKSRKGSDTCVDERALSYEVLKVNCRKLFGVSISTFEGVTAGMESGMYTVSEMRAKLKTWLKKEVK